jgi:hypothetical protein
MSNSPEPTPRHSQTEILIKSTDVRTPTPIADTSISDKTDLPSLLKADEMATNSTTSHVDENNENEAVCKKY